MSHPAITSQAGCGHPAHNQNNFSASGSSLRTRLRRTSCRAPPAPLFLCALRALRVQLFRSIGIRVHPRYPRGNNPYLKKEYTYPTLCGRSVNSNRKGTKSTERKPSFLGPTFVPFVTLWLRSIAPCMYFLITLRSSAFGFLPSAFGPPPPCQFAFPG